MNQDAYSPAEFERCAPLLDAAIRRGHDPRSINEIRAGCEASEFILLPGERSAMVLDRRNDRGMNVCEVMLVGGVMDEVTGPLFDRAERYAEQTGAHWTVVNGRRGWVRQLRQRGYDLHGVNGDCWTIAKAMSRPSASTINGTYMTAINALLRPHELIIATDTLGTDGRDIAWGPCSFVMKVAPVIQLKATLFSTGFGSLLMNAANLATVAPTGSVADLLGEFQRLAQRVSARELAAMRRVQPQAILDAFAPCGLYVFWHDADAGRIVGRKLICADNFEPREIGDGLHQSPGNDHGEEDLSAIATEEDLVRLTMRQHEIDRLQSDGLSIGGDVIAWRMAITESGRVSYAQDVHARLSTYGRDLAAMRRRAGIVSAADILETA